MKTILWIAVIIVIVAGGWYLWSEHEAALPAPATVATTTAATTTNDVTDNLALGVDSNQQLGQFLIAYNGMTVYTYGKDSRGTSTCYDTCTQNWPPYTVPAGTTLNAEANATGTLATITRADGTMQVTYNGMPLYFYAEDQSVGDTKGQGVGGVWVVVKP